MTDAPPDPAASAALPATREERRKERLSVGSWILYDWANSVYPTVVVTFIFAAYFRDSVVGAEGTEGTELWSRIIAVSGFIIAFLAPILGSIADEMGRQKPLIGGFTLIVGLAAIGLWWVTPDASSIVLAMLLVVIGNVAFEVAQVFYNAMLPFVARPEKLGRISGWGWAFGYVGGLVCLVLCLILFIMPAEPLWGLSKEQAEHVRIIGPFVGLWVIVFAIPMLLYTREQPTTGTPIARAARQGLSSLWKTIKRLPRFPSLLRFLIASMLYRDGLLTLFAFGGLYFSALFLTPELFSATAGADLDPSAEGFAMELASWKSQQILIFAIVLNVTSALGAFGMAWVDDWLGSKAAISLSLVGLMLFGFVAALTGDYWVFYATAAGIGLFIGPIQSASRSYLARLVPGKDVNEFFGLYALTGKTTAFLGPLIYGLATGWFETERAGMLSIMLFMAVGLALLLTVSPAREARKRLEAEATSKG